jgi:hypothetical protein
VIQAGGGPAIRTAKLAATVRRNRMGNASVHARLGDEPVMDLATRAQDMVEAGAGFVEADRPVAGAVAGMDDAELRQRFLRISDVFSATTSTSRLRKKARLSR